MSRLATRAALPALFALALAGCAALPRQGVAAWPLEIAPRVELVSVPFFAQTRFHCGPAALATLLTASGRPTHPDALVEQVYVPQRRGSLQAEMVAAVRRHERVPYVLEPRFEDLVREVAAGRPVLVLQNLGLRRWPRWHYAAVAGYDRARDALLLRSGAEPALWLSASAFERSWEGAQRWALVALRADELAATAQLARVLRTGSDFEEMGELGLAADIYAAARQRWPGQSLPYVALANVALARGDGLAAEHLLREAASRASPDPIVHNNLAELLARRGCIREAMRELEAARPLAAAGPWREVIEQTAREVRARSDVQPSSGDSCS